jgi:hypothetical protein
LIVLASCGFAASATGSNARVGLVARSLRRAVATGLSSLSSESEVLSS